MANLNNTTPIKSVQFNRPDRDFSAFVDGILIGVYTSRHAAEVACDTYVFEALTSDAVYTARQLDGGRTSMMTLNV